jgi:hypothetical protein
MGLLIREECNRDCSHCGCEVVPGESTLTIRRLERSKSKSFIIRGIGRCWISYRKNNQSLAPASSVTGYKLRMICF